MLQTWWTFSTISCIIAKSSRLTHPERIANINHHIYPHNGKRRPATQYVQTQVGAYAATQLPNHLLILHDGSLSSGIQLVLLSKLPSIVTIVEIPKWWGKTHTHTPSWNMEWMEMFSAIFQSCSFQQTSKFNPHKYNGANKSKVLNTNAPSTSYVGHLDSVTFLFSSFKASFAPRNFFHPLFPVKVTKNIASVPVLSSGAQLCSLNFHFLFEVLQKRFHQRRKIKRTRKNDENTTEWDDDFQKVNLFSFLQGLIFQVLGSMFFSIGVRWSKYICKTSQVPS